MPSGERNDDQTKPGEQVDEGYAPQIEAAIQELDEALGPFNHVAGA
jgi:hypothetical protein